MRTAEFDYELPAERVAQAPVEPRHESRLLDTRDLSNHRFVDLPELLAPGDLVVVNRTRVRRARLVGAIRDGTGKVELLVLGKEDGIWRALARPARRVRRGDVIDFDGLTADVVGTDEDGVVDVTLSTPDGVEPAQRIEHVGQVPLPPYFRGHLPDPERYQTMFATDATSAAAPTAGLHFTPTVVAALAARGIDTAAVELEIGIDTFRPMRVELVADHRIHTERYRVDDAAVSAVERCREQGGRVVAVGTTVVRTLETVSRPDGGVRSGGGRTDLFITPGYRFRVVDVLVTNFHVPRSTLLALVAAFMGDAWREAYRIALERRYRFLSFGDAMLAERAA